MLIPYTVDVPMERVPVMNWLVIAATVGVSCFAWYSGSAAWHPYALHRDGGDPVQLFSHVLLHADAAHLIGNTLFLFCFGNAVNAKLGHVAYLVLYLALGAVAAVTWRWFGHGLYAVGASGAIFGVIGVLLVLYPKNDVSVFYWFYGRSGTFEISAYWIILLYVAFDLWGLKDGAATRVAHVSHLAGAAGGVGTACAVLLAGFARPTEVEENLLQALGWQRTEE